MLLLPEITAFVSVNDHTFTVMHAGNSTMNKNFDLFIWMTNSQQISVINPSVISGWPPVALQQWTSQPGVHRDSRAGWVSLVFCVMSWCVAAFCRLFLLFFNLFNPPPYHDLISFFFSLLSSSSSERLTWRWDRPWLWLETWETISKNWQTSTVRLLLDNQLLISVFLKWEACTLYKHTQAINLLYCLPKLHSRWWYCVQLCAHWSIAAKSTYTRQIIPM